MGIKDKEVKVKGCWRGFVDLWVRGYLVRNGRDPPVDLDDPLTRAACAFCARGGICDDGVCCGEISVLETDKKTHLLAQQSTLNGS